MLSDLALSAAVGCDPKWLHNASERIGHPIARTAGDAVWWRLTYQIASGVHAPIADAAKAATTLLSLGPDAGRVRIRMNAEDSIGLSVDVGAFHDCAALALASAIEFTVPGRRGRPPRATAQNPGAMQGRFGDRPAVGAPELLRTAFDAASNGGADRAAPQDFLAVLGGAGIDPVVLLDAGGAGQARHTLLRIAVQFDSTLVASVLANALNAIEARPRGVPTRPAFRFEAGLIRAVGDLALTVKSVPINLLQSVPGVADWIRLRQLVETVSLGTQRFSVIVQR